MIRLFFLKPGYLVNGILTVCIIFFLVHCGKKTLPVPVIHFDPPPVKNFDYTIDGTKVNLSWSFPVQDIPDVSIPDYFLVERSQVELNDGECDGCPQSFIDIAEIKNTGNGTYAYRGNLVSGFRYSFRVVPVSKNGQKGPFSNVIIFRYEGPKPGGLKGDPSI